MSKLISNIKINNENFEIKDENARNNITDINRKISSLASGTPIAVNSIEEMTDTTKVYVNTIDGNWYYYNDSWQIGGQYQSTQIANKSISNELLADGVVNTRVTDFLKVDSQNVFNGKIHTGFINTTGIKSTDSNYRYTDFIPIRTNQYISLLIREINGSGVCQERAFLNVGVRFITWYDSEFNVIEGNGFSNDDYANKDSIQAIDDNVAYAVVTFKSDLATDQIIKDRMMICVTDEAIAEPIAYNSYKEKLNEKVINNDNQNETIKLINEFMYDNLIQKSNNNLLNPLANTKGTMQRAGHIDGNYFYTPKIKIKKGQFLTLRKKNENDNNTTVCKIRIVVFYDIKGNIVKYYDNPEGIVETVECDVEDVFYCIPTIYFEQNTNDYMLTVSDENTTNDVIEFEEFKGNILLPVPEKNNLSQKIIVNFGDSIAAGDYGTSYGEQIATKNNMTYHSYANGGATLGTERTDNGNETNLILNQINNFLGDNITPDYILINGGTNDILYCEIGQKSDFYSENETNTWDTSKTVGALEKIFYLLKTNKPNSKIIYVIPHRMQTRDYTLQNNLFSLIKEICKKWSIPVVSIFDEGNLNTNIEAMRIYTDTGTHPTAEGYEKFYVPLIESKMKQV